MAIRISMVNSLEYVREMLFNPSSGNWLQYRLTARDNMKFERTRSFQLFQGLIQQGQYTL